MSKTDLPREVVKWLQVLDLSYKVKNVKRDLSNGFVAAEIISRYHPDCIDMHSFESKLSLEEKDTNWNYIKKVCKKFPQIPIKEDILNDVVVDKIKNQAPNVAYEFLLNLYRALNKKEPVITKRVDETDEFRSYTKIELLPKYMKPTVNNILKDHEIDRIKDDLTRYKKITEVLNKHREYLAFERETFRKLRWKRYKNNTVSKGVLKETKYDGMKNTKHVPNEQKIIDDENSKLEESQMKNENQKKEEKFNLMIAIKETSKTLNDYNFENYLVEIISKNFIEGDYNVELELKKYGDEISIIEFFFTNFNLCHDEKLFKIFSYYEEKSHIIVDIISKTLIELISFIKIITRFIDILIKNGKDPDILLNTSVQICEEILNKDQIRCENIFINYGLNIILDFIKQKPYYRNIMCQLIFSLISRNNKYAYFEVLKAIRKRYIDDEILFYHVIVKCLENLNSDIIDERIHDFFVNVCEKGIYSSCDVIRIKTLYLIHLFVNYDTLEVLEFVNPIFRLTKSWNWEILSLILIFCSDLLGQLNYIRYERNVLLEENKNSNQEDSKKFKEDLENFDTEINAIEKYEDQFIKTIEEIFELKSPNMTIKIGFLYLASILEYYPSLAEKYMKILIEINYESIRNDVLKIENSDKVDHYSTSIYTEKYKYCGAPKEWNAIKVAGIFRNYVKSKLDRLEMIHLLIFQSIIINQDFEDNFDTEWIEIYNDLKEYLFASLCQKEYTNISLDIFKKFFSFDKILSKLLEDSFEKFLRSMKIIYKSLYDEECLNNMKYLLTYISEIKFDFCMEYIYRLIKDFAIHNNDYYLKSNLVDLMNNLYKKLRGEIFD